MGFGPHQAFGAQGQVPSVPVGLTRPCPGTQDIVSQLQTSTTLPRYTSPSFHSTLPQPGHLWTYQTIQDNESAADHSRNQNKSSARGPPTDYCSAPEGQRLLELDTPRMYPVSLLTRDTCSTRRTLGFQWSYSAI